MSIDNYFINQIPTRYQTYFQHESDIASVKLNYRGVIWNVGCSPVQLLELPLDVVDALGLVLLALQLISFTIKF